MKRVWRVLEAALALAIMLGIGFLMRPVSYFDGWMYVKEDFSGIDSRSVKVEGYRMHYLAEGPENGPVVLLLHGLGGRSEDWSNLAPYFARAGFRVYMPDLIGYGRSQRPQNFSYSVRDEAGVVVEFMDALGMKQVDLGGWSMGGWIAQLVALDHPERVKRLMLFDSAGLDVKPAWNTALFTPTTPAQLDELDALLMPHPPPVPRFVARDIIRIFERNGWVIKRAMASMLTARDVTDKLLPQLKMPVLIEWGSLDQITPNGQAEAMHKLIPQSQLHVAEGCGHLAPYECAGAMGPVAVKFVEE